MRRLLPALVVLLVLAAPALGDDVTKKHQVESKISSLQDRLAAQKAQERTLRNEVSGYTQRIRSLEAQVGDVSLRLQTLQADLGLHRKRLDALDRLYGWQTARWRFLKSQYARAQRQLRQRIVEIYESDDASTIDLVLGSSNLQDALDRVEYLDEIAASDRRLAAQAAAARARSAAARLRTKGLRATVQGETRAISARAAQVQEVRNELEGARGDLVSTRQAKLVDLSSLTAAERDEASEIDALQAASLQLAAQIRAAQARSSSGPTQTPSSAGLIWPVEGPITSPFGWRWGRMHEGIDIGVPYGTPIHAAAAGTIIYCGWEEGYGNLVVIDHGGNLATAYGHQSSIAVTCGESVTQGQVIGYVGCTGHCTGPHLHFEVRVGGNPVDPLGYL
ncbi:MAG TPA: peptidoglycan DD-metalloendopeptidase family protein [Gaiellaceae bacterium]|nr:peptidoglycan DD-metalloendopeptidase family protein [Gaiellaceae bacterium]